MSESGDSGADIRKRAKAPPIEDGALDSLLLAPNPEDPGSGNPGTPRAKGLSCPIPEPGFPDPGF